MPSTSPQAGGHLIEVIGLKKVFETRSSILARMRAKARKPILAVDGISFHIDRGEGLGLIGESGCGKTTTAMLLLRLINPSAGKIFFDGLELTSMNARALRLARRRMQMVFQDPYESLNPGKSVSSIIAEPLVVHRLARDKRQRESMITAIMEQMGLVPAVPARAKRRAETASCHRACADSAARVHNCRRADIHAGRVGSSRHLESSAQLA